MTAVTQPPRSGPTGSTTVESYGLGTRSGAAGPVLILAMIAVGLMAGLFYTFSIAVMLGLGQTDDRTFVLAMQKINEEIQNPAFAPAFFGSIVFPVAAAIMHRRLGATAVVRWIVAGLGFYALAFVVTRGFNIPLNDDLAAAGDPDRIPNLAQVRDDFEGPWVAWNLVRMTVSILALACLGRALVLHGRSVA